MPSTDTALPRRHEIDAVRSIALLLLVAYHALIAFQPFASSLMFIGYRETLAEVWFLGQLVNPWRIPVLFLIAGITAGYLLTNRSVFVLVRARLKRLVPPLIFTMCFIAPINPVLFAIHTGAEPRWIPHGGHLWFVWNLTIYFVFAVPVLLWLKHRPHDTVVRLARNLSPLWWLVTLPAWLALVTLVLEPHIGPDDFAAHFMRFWYGFACFVAGIVLVSSGEVFWSGIRRVGPVAVPVALVLYALRMVDVEVGSREAALVLHAGESAFGMLGFLGLGARFLTRPSPTFAAMNRAVFAVYILHLPVQQAVALVLYRVDANVWLMFVLHMASTLALSVALYAFVLRPLQWLHPLFGIAATTPVPPSAKPHGS